MESRIIVTAELSQIRGRLDMLQRLKVVRWILRKRLNQCSTLTPIGECPPLNIFLSKFLYLRLL